jgi:hypothetical protein
MLEATQGKKVDEKTSMVSLLVWLSLLKANHHLT